jgi:hypothetical protein
MFFLSARRELLRTLAGGTQVHRVRVSSVGWLRRGPWSRLVTWRGVYRLGVLVYFSSVPLLVDLLLVLAVAVV